MGTAKRQSAYIITHRLLDTRWSHSHHNLLHNQYLVTFKDEEAEADYIAT